MCLVAGQSKEILNTLPLCFENISLETMWTWPSHLTHSVILNNEESVKRHIQLDCDISSKPYSCLN